jgi:tetratricopeptide (TPR) repeat protein
MRYVVLLMAVSTCVGVAQDPDSLKEQMKADIQANTPAQRGERGNPPSAPGLATMDPHHVIPFDPSLPPAPSDNQVEVVGVTSAQLLLHKVPKQAKKAFERAAKLSKARKHAEAARELERAIAVDPGFAEAHVNLGAQYYLLNRLQDAQRLLRRATELDPSSAGGFSNLAAVELLRGDLVSAEQHARRALSLSPGNEPAKRIFDSAYRKIQH